MSYQFITYMIIGALSACTQLTTLLLFKEYLILNDNLSITLSFIFSVLIHFFGNKYVTFSKNKLNLKQAYRYISVVFLNYILTMFVSWLCILSFNLNIYFATTISILSTVINGFTLSKYWVFKTT